MSKKLLVAVLALALVFGLAPLKKVSAMGTDDLTVEGVQTYIPDPVFAAAVVAQIKEDAERNPDEVDYFDIGAYDNVKDVLLAYSGTISITSTEGDLVQSIVGINYLQNALISIANQNVQDLSPIADGSMITNANGNRHRPIQISNVPARIWPDSALINVDKDHYALPTPLRSKGSALYAYSTDGATLTVIYDYQNLKINESTNATRYETTGPVTPSKDKPQNGDTTASFTFVPTVAGMALARNSSVPFTYTSEEEDATLPVAYWYTMDLDVVYPVLVEKEVSSKFSVELVKYSTEDVDKENPLAGAVYELYKEGEDDDEYIGSYTTKTTPVVIEDLTAGDYYFIEIEAPKGYKKDETPITFSYTDIDDFTVDASGLDDEVTVVQDGAEFTPVWEAGKGSEENPFDLVTDDYTAARASHYSTETKDCIGLVQNGTEVSLNITCSPLADNANMDGTYTYYVNGTKTNNVQKAINDLLAANAVDGPITIKVVAEFELKASERTVAEGLDTPITIWVENSTENDEGGTVNVQGCPEDEISSSTVYENVPREINNVVEGQAYKEDGWYVVVDEIMVGPMGPDGQSGATYVVVDQPQDADGNYIITLEDGSEIKVQIEYNESTEHVVVTIVDMDQNIDVAIPFARRSEEPIPTGDNTKTAILVASMLASGSLIGYVLFKKRKEEE